MKIIDFHTHIYPDRIAKNGSQSICDFYNLDYCHTGRADILLSEGKSAGISEFLLLPVAISPQHVRHINMFTADEAAEHEEFHGFGTIHAASETIMDDLKQIRELGLQGIKIHPDTQHFPIDDPRMYPVYDAASDELPFVIHCGDPRYEFSRPERLKKILHEFPKLRVVAAHLGGWQLFDEAFKYLKDENCYFDFSSCMMFIGKDKTERYVKSYGADRIVFGTDFPSWNPATEVERFMSLDLSEEEREKIAHLKDRKSVV